MGNDGPRFRKRGRPPENRVARRLEIFLAVAPALAEQGSRMTMKEAARRANVSVGTLYYYFGAKRALLLYGLDPEPATILCRSFAARYRRYRISDARRYREALLNFLVATLEAMRASVDAAIRLGPEVVRDRINRVVREPIPAFIQIIRDGLPPSIGDSSGSVERIVRTVLAAGLLEPELDARRLRRELRHILGG